MQVRIARGEVWVEGLAKPVTTRRDGWSAEGWSAEGSFEVEVEQGTDEELRSLSATVGAATRGDSALVYYEATFVVPHGRDAITAPEGSR